MAPSLYLHGDLSATSPALDGNAMDFVDLSFDQHQGFRFVSLEYKDPDLGIRRYLAVQATVGGDHHVPREHRVAIGVPMLNCHPPILGLLQFAVGVKLVSSALHYLVRLRCFVRSTVTWRYACAFPRPPLSLPLALLSRLGHLAVHLTPRRFHSGERSSSQRIDGTSSEDGPIGGTNSKRDGMTRLAPCPLLACIRLVTVTQPHTAPTTDPHQSEPGGPATPRSILQSPTPRRRSTSETFFGRETP